jgi:mitochondrial fission protein ELM1
VKGIPRDPVCWALTEGFAGMENQCVGLAEAVGSRCEVKHVRRPRAPVMYLSPRLWPNPLASTTDGIPLAPPWPDLLISSGRGSVAAALAIRKASRNRTFAVHIQRPYVRPSRFDLVVMPLHDSLRGDNVLVARTALHRVTSEKLGEAAQRFKPALSHLPRPLIAVLVGGSNKHQRFSADTMGRLASDLVLAVEECGGSLAVTPSRRTGEENERILRERLNSVPAFLWDGRGENPYLGLLALADAIVVTSDSVSMVSEATATGKPVHIFAIGDGGKKLRRFHKALLDDGVTRIFTATIESWSYNPPDETARIAALVRRHLRASLGNSVRWKPF